MTSTTLTHNPSRPSHVKVATASLIGTAIEWYDFFLYGTAAALIFNKLFFPTFDPWIGTLLAFTTYALGFVARPLGGLVFGHYGDKIGRKTMLYLTLLIMGVATALIGVLPTYEQLGVWAPVLLVTCRLVQGFGLGGEWGGAVLMAVEHAPEDKKGFYGSWPQLGAPLGLVLGTLVFSVVSAFLTDAQLLAWGWRVPFLISILLVIVGLWIRFTIAESPGPSTRSTPFTVTRICPSSTKKNSSSFSWKCIGGSDPGLDRNSITANRPSVSALSAWTRTWCVKN